MEKRKDVSIRLNGVEKTFEESSIKKESLEKTETHEEGEQEIAASNEKKEDDWMILGQQKDSSADSSKKIIDFKERHNEKQERGLPFWDDGKRDSGPRLPPFRRKKKGPPRLSFSFLFQSVFMAGLAAIIVGGAFGLMLLNIFAGGGDDSSVTGTDSGQVANAPQGIPAVADTDEDGLYPIDPFNVFIIQGGAFSLKEKAEEIKTYFRSENLPAIITENTAPMYLFIGIGATRDDAEKITAYYNEKGKDTYIKEYGILANGARVSKEWDDFLTKGVNWMEKAATVSAKDIGGEPLSDQEVQSMLEAGQAWKASFELLEGDKETLKYSSAENWLNTGQSAFQVYASSVSSSEIAWETQNTLLNSMLTYEKLIHDFNKNQ